MIVSQAICFKTIINSYVCNSLNDLILANFA